MRDATTDVVRRASGPRLTKSQLRKLLRFAAEVEGIGFRYLPLTGKRPVASWRKSQLTEDFRSIESLVRKSSATGIGLWLGGEHRPGEHLFVLDIDTRNGGLESLPCLLERLGRKTLFRTALTETKGKEPGWHYYFTAPFLVRCGSLACHGLPGLDVKGAGGYVVAPGSLHPDTLEPYRCTRHPRVKIAPAPRSLLSLLQPYEPRGGEPGWRRLSQSSGNYPGGNRRGDLGKLSEDIIGRFPIKANGQRHVQMVRAVGRLVGHGYTDGDVLETLATWHAHFYREGLTRTNASSHMGEVAKCLRGTRSNTEFVASAVDHQGERARYEFPPGIAAKVTIAIKGLVGEETGPENAVPSPHCKGFPPIRECLTVSDESWVEAVLIACLYAARNGEFAVAGSVRITSQQIGQIMEDRFGVILGKSALSKIRAKFVDRLHSPATKVPLLRELTRGVPGKPSEFEPVGILALIELCGVQPVPDAGLLHTSGAGGGQSGPSR